MVLVLVAATFPEAPARFQPRRPLEPPDWWLVKEPGDERGGAPADGVPGSLSDPCSDSPDDLAPTDSLEGRTNSAGMATGKSKAPGQSPGRDLLQWVEEEADHFPGLPRRELQIGRTGDSGGREAL